MIFLRMFDIIYTYKVNQMYFRTAAVLSCGDEKINATHVGMTDKGLQQRALSSRTEKKAVIMLKTHDESCHSYIDDTQLYISP